MQDSRESDWERVKQSSLSLPPPFFFIHSGTVLRMLHMYKHEHKVLTHPLTKGVHRHFSQKNNRMCAATEADTSLWTLSHLHLRPPTLSHLFTDPQLLDNNNNKKTLRVAFLHVLRPKTFRRVLWLSSGSPASSRADLRTPLCSSPGLSAGAAAHTVSKKQPRPRH